MIRFPAEWERQAAVMIAWPRPDGDFANLNRIEADYQAIAQTIARYQPLLIICPDQAQQKHITGQLETLDNIHFVHADYNDIWLRDTAFLTVENNGKAELLDFRFNGWGGKYRHDFDDALCRNLVAGPVFNGVPVRHLDWVLEGGSVESDGQGTLLTTEQCLLNANRNPNFSRLELERRLEQAFGVERVLWLSKNALAGDDTDAHIDTLARFCRPDLIAYTACSDPEHPEHQDLQHLAAQLAQLTDAQGQPYQRLPLELPKPIYNDQGEPLPTNYANFLFVNQALLVPAYGCPEDEAARAQLAQAFPEREVVSVPCRAVVEQYGSLHCMTMQLPAGVHFPC
ncbi:MAG: agmatine deiminase family protein [Methylococcales bacterium]|nr:agmatine deiminase family protein [Methylococcales bacterium]